MIFIYKHCCVWFIASKYLNTNCAVIVEIGIRFNSHSKIQEILEKALKMTRICNTQYFNMMHCTILLYSSYRGMNYCFKWCWSSQEAPLK